MPVNGGWLRYGVAIGAAIDGHAGRSDPAGLRVRAETALDGSIRAGGNRPRIAGYVPIDGLEDKAFV